MIVICGAPGSGKTTYVREHKGTNDLVVDVDMLFAALTLRPLYDKPERLLGKVLDVRDFVVEVLSPQWVVSSDPSKAYRAQMRGEFVAEVIVLETPAAVCLQRIHADPRREGETDWDQLVAKWWELYEADERDEVIK